MRHLLALSSLLALAACVPGSDGKDFAGGDDSGGIGDSGPAEDHGTGDVNGTVRVQLYETGADGEIAEVDWAEGESFPFGAIYVAAYTLDEETGETTYHAETVIPTPSVGGDTYALAVDLDDAEEVRVYAALDWWPDGVIGTGEPVGIYDGLVPVVEGSAVDGVDIVVNAPRLPTGGGGGGGSYVSIDGDLTITQEYGGGAVKVMLYDAYSQGPSYVTNANAVATEDGGAGSYALTVGADYGEGRLIAAWDDDQNGLIEPTDVWGAYVTSGENGNPITVGTGAMSGYDVQIPFGIPPRITPFVRLEGVLGYRDGYETFPAGAVVYVAALKTRPEGDFSVAALEEGYDWQSFTGAELSGVMLDYLLLAPSSATVYLWTYVDLDGDGLLNEAGEPVGSYGDTGRLTTGATNQAGLDMELHAMVE